MEFEQPPSRAYGGLRAGDLLDDPDDERPDDDDDVVAVAEAPRPPRVRDPERMRRISRALLVVGLIAAAFVVALLLGAGGITGFDRAPRSVDAGGFSFTYPRSWTVMRKAGYPERSGSAALVKRGTIALGACPRIVAASRCEATAGTLHMLLFADRSLVSVNGLAGSLDRSLPRRFTTFRRRRVGMFTTADGSRALRYEFAFRKRGIRLHEIVALYPGARTGALVVVQGTERQVLASRAAIDRVLVSARERR